MAFKVGSFEGVTIVGIADPRLAAAVQAFGRIWEEVQHRPGAADIIDEAVRTTEELAERAADLAGPGDSAPCVRPAADAQHHRH